MAPKLNSRYSYSYDENPKSNPKRSHHEEKKQNFVKGFHKTACERKPSLAMSGSFQAPTGHLGEPIEHLTLLGTLGGPTGHFEGPTGPLLPSLYQDN